MQCTPDLEETGVVVTPAERARSVPGREGRRLVEEEQLRELAGLQERRAMPVLEAQATRDPTPAVVAPPDPALLVVQAAAVPIDEPAGRRGDQLAERRDAIPARHALTLLVVLLEELESALWVQRVPGGDVAGELAALVQRADCAGDGRLDRAVERGPAVHVNASKELAEAFERVGIREREDVHARSIARSRRNDHPPSMVDEVASPPVIRLSHRESRPPGGRPLSPRRPPSRASRLPSPCDVRRSPPPFRRSRGRIVAAGCDPRLARPGDQVQD